MALEAWCCSETSSMPVDCLVGIWEEEKRGGEL